MTASMAVRCSDATFRSDQHQELTELSGVFLCIWAVGVPLMLAGLLIGAKHAGSSSSLAQATSLLSREYDGHSFFWEVLEIVRRILLTALVLAIPSAQSMVRLLVAIIACFLYLVMLLVVRPFKRVDDTIVAIFSNVMLVFCFLTASIVKIFDEYRHRSSNLRP